MKFTLSDVVPMPYIVTNFSIEYPSHYKSLFVHSSSSHEMVVTNSPPGSDITNNLDNSLWISAFNASEASVHDYLALLEAHLSSIQSKSGAEFKLIERSPTTIDGEKGERIAYYYLRNSIPEKSESILAVSYRVYFENNGFLWLIDVDAISEKAEQVKADFEHIIHTFRFLD